MAKSFSDVSEMIKKLSLDDNFKRQATKELKDQEISKFLFALRCENDLTQSQLANKIGCSQGRISKIENSCDSEISIKDLLDYGKALNLQLEIGYRNKSTKLVDLIKYHALKIKTYLDSLVELVKDDEDMAKGVLTFHLEAFTNLSNFTLENIPKLHKKISQKTINHPKDSVYISTPLSDKMGKKFEKSKIP